LAFHVAERLRHRRQQRASLAPVPDMEDEPMGLIHSH